MTGTLSGPGYAEHKGIYGIILRSVQHIESMETHHNELKVMQEGYFHH